MSTRIHLDPNLQQPTLALGEVGFTITLPLPSVSEEGTMSFLGYEFAADSGKAEVGRLFRASVLHLSTHTLMPINNGNVDLRSKNTLVEAFTESLVNDVYVNVHVAAFHPDRLADLAFANSLAFAKMKRAERIFNPATRIMAALLLKINVGMAKGVVAPEEEDVINQLTAKLSSFKERIAASLRKENAEIGEALDETRNEVARVLELHSPIVESPSLQYTERTGPSTVFPRSKVLYAPSHIEKIFKRSLETLGGILPRDESMESCWSKKADIEASQAFDSHVHGKSREEKVLAKIGKYTESSRFKSVGFPPEEYTQYLRARTLLRGGSRRLLDSLRVAKDALDEDPRKEMGQLDITEVIQKIASRSPRTDVFMQNEYLSSSFAWAVLFDASASMKIRGKFARALAICVAEATMGLLMDPGSWAFYAFSDRFYILKDVSEAYSYRVRARIGGLEFGGLTYMPDAIRVAGEILAQRFDDQRFLVVLSDGWPYGYANMSHALSESISSLEEKGIIVIGVGLESERMAKFFRMSCAVYNQKDLIKKFANIYLRASTAALEG